MFKLSIGYPTNNMVLVLKGQRLGLESWLRLELRQQQYGVGSNSMSALQFHYIYYCKCFSRLCHFLRFGIAELR